MSTKPIGTTMYLIAIVAFIALMAWLFSAQIDDYRNPNTDPDARVSEQGTAQVILQRNRAGHYVASGELNGVAVEFMLDTGATDVAVSADVARRAGLRAGPAMIANTANGSATVYKTQIDSIRLGAIVEYGIRASIVPNLDEIEVLLGMSFLQRLDFAQRGDTLIIDSRRPDNPRSNP